MRLPSTVDPRRRRAGGRTGTTTSDRGAAEHDDEYEYVYVDELDGTDLGDGWEWVEVDGDDQPPDPDRPASATRSGRIGRFLANLLPFDEHGGDDGPPETAEPDGAEPWVAEPAVAEVEPEPRRRSRREDRALETAEAEELDDPWDDADDLDDDDDLLPVDPRIAARRDGVAQARRARLRRRLVALAVVVAIVFGLGAVTRSAVLDVDEVTVTGAARSSAADIAAASGITPGTPLIGLDLEAAEARVRAEPWVLDATIDQTWSGTVSIAVVEREPVATVNAGTGGWLLVDGARRVVAVSTDPPALPIVDGVGVAAVGGELAPDAQAALDVAAALTPGLRTRVAVVNGADPDAVELTLTPTGTVRFGPATQIEERLGTLQSVFAQVDLLCLQTIDLRVADAARLTRVPACA